ncbi:MAG: hypothetical protein LBR22_10365 [Desulfovibrio sp.]|jgi:hypothetical protein|nr:hypothetical protein [Desulfovibrio sp.]
MAIQSIALKEAREAKNALYKKIKDMTPEERGNYISKAAQEAMAEFGYKIKYITPEEVELLRSRMPPRR